jgi:ABC-type bacteriocin/lantibiotic exporter with double-glycine peptidase domain
MGTQSRWNSILESLSNTAVGMLTTLIFSPIIYKTVGMTYTYSQLGAVTILFTTLSIVRSYIIRRFFNKKTN